MTTTKFNKDLAKELMLIKDNEEAMQKVLDATRRIRLEYVVTAAPIEAKKEKEVTPPHNPLRGCWNDPEGEELYEFMRHVRDNKNSREVILD